MKVTFLGTGAAQGVPPSFSKNNFFDYIRKTKGKELRSKAALRLGNRSQIDFGPDSNWQNIRNNLDAYDIKNIFITHSHSDHLSCFELFEVYKMAFEVSENCNPEPINLFLSKPAVDWVYNDFLPAARMNPLKDRIIPHPLDYFHSYQCDDIMFDTVKGFHKAYGENESSINYLFKKGNGKSLFYAVDTGYYSDDTFEYLQDKKTDTVIMECTFGDNYDRGNIGDGHLNLKTLNKQIEKLANIGFLTERTPLYITHISSIVEHKFDEFQEILSQSDFNYILSYDGLAFDF